MRRDLRIYNADTEDIGVLASASRPKHFGYCTSVKCCEREIFRKGKKQRVVLPRVFRTADMDMDKCSYCGSTLLWKREGK